MICWLEDQAKRKLCIPLKLLDNNSWPPIIVSFVLSFFIEEFSTYLGSGSIESE